MDSRRLRAVKLGRIKLLATENEDFLKEEKVDQTDFIQMDSLPESK